MLQPKDTDWLNGYNEKTHIYAVYQKPTSDQRHIQTESKRMEKYIPCKYILHGSKRKLEQQSSGKIDLKIKKITRDKEGHYIMIKALIQEEDITIANIYASNIGAPQYIRQALTDVKGEIESNTIIVGDFNTSLIPMNK